MTTASEQRKKRNVLRKLKPKRANYAIEDYHTEGSRRRLALPKPLLIAASTLSYLRKWDFYYDNSEARKSF